MMLKLAVACLVVATAVTPQSAAPSPQEPPATVLEDIVVDGRPLREAVDAFVDGVTEPPRGRGPARWHRRVCVGAVNLRRDAAQALIDRVSQVAEAVGLEPGEPGCQANILVIATNDAPALAAALVDARPRAFRPDYAGASAPPSALEAFRTSPNPVRWWHVSMPVVRDTGEPAVRLAGQDPPIIPGAGLLRTNVANRLLRTFVILDITRMENMTFDQLGDYVAMVSLAQIDPEAETSGFDSVLNLFSEQRGDQSLTDWDRAYLRALYDAELNERHPNAQLGGVSTIMERDRRTAAGSLETP